jgi:hypothetical protein
MEPLGPPPAQSASSDAHPDPAIVQDTRQAGPTARAIRAALKRLSVRGAHPYWVKDRCPILLELKGVQSRLDANPRPTREEATAALVDYLKNTVQRVDWDQHRIVLEVVLALEDEYLDLNAKDRQTLAGKRCRGDRHTLSASSVRQKYEPEALEKLYLIVLEDEGIEPPAKTAAAPEPDLD